MESNKVYQIEVLSTSGRQQETINTIKKMLTRGDDLEMGVVSAINLYNGTVKKAPLHGTPPRGLIFKAFNN